jgi:GNAT superfamily N-acetyltransferase
MDTGELMRLHVRALFAQDGDGRLLTVNEPGGQPAPRFLLGRTTSEKLWWVRHDVDAALVDELRTLCEAEAWNAVLAADSAGSTQFVTALARKSPVEHVWSGPAFHCPPDLVAEGTPLRITPANAQLLTPYLEDWHVDVKASIPMAASLHDGMAVSVCCSVRVTDRAHEAGVETHPEFRGRGHATRAVAEWAAAVWQLRCVPLYSTSWENASSRALARRLGLVQFGADLHIT